MKFSALIPLLLVCCALAVDSRMISGRVIDKRGDAVQGVSVSAAYEGGEETTQTDEQGEFAVRVPAGNVTLSASGKYIVPNQLAVKPSDPGENLVLPIAYRIPAAHESLTVSAASLDPTIDRRNDAVYSKTLLSRDDQIFDTLAAGINAGQHEGGGKSLEIRRFGFNLDHGGVNGGLKVLVDDVQQNQATQGHGQGYLGALKSLTPELIDDVDILNGPFSAQYGDFSGLGVVHIRLKESLPDRLTVRLQGGSFGSYRGFLGFSPTLNNADAFIAYEGAHTDGPFISPLRYNRNNLTANYTRHLDQKQTLGFKLNFGTNDFFSPGQVPLDLVASGQLNRFGFVDPDDGGRVRLGTLGVYYKREFNSGDSFRLDGFVARSLFDLYSNFTFFLDHYLPTDPIHGDEIQQHDSRLQQGVNATYLHPYKIFGHSALLTVGSNFHDNQINVGLFNTEQRVPVALETSAHAHVTNSAVYAQHGVDFLQGRLHLDGGLRLDYFRFAVDDHIDSSHGGTQGASRIQPKANFSYTPSLRLPLTFFASYGRGISSQDARGVVQRPDAPRVATTDFYEVGTSHHLRRFSLSTDLFLINRSNEQVYVPDDGTFEFKGPSRSYGWEAKTSLQLTRRASFNAGFTQVSNAFYLGTLPRQYVTNAPHSVANAGVTLSAWRGFNASLRYRHISSYILDPDDDPAVLAGGIFPRASGLDVVDFAVSKRLTHAVDFNFAVDNLNNKRYWETQNYLESRVTPAAAPLFRIHGTPGYPIGFTAGFTIHLGEK